MARGAFPAAPARRVWPGPGTHQPAQPTVTNGSTDAGPSVCTRRSVCLPRRSRSRDRAMTIRRYWRSQPEPQLALMVRAFPVCRRQRPSWPGPSPQPHRRKPQDCHRRWRDITAFSCWPGPGIPVPARACRRTSRRRARASTPTVAAGVLAPGRDRGDSAVECPSPAPPRPAAPGCGSPGCRLVTRPSSSQRPDARERPHLGSMWMIDDHLRP
jgi:hypothetical protein